MRLPQKMCLTRKKCFTRSINLLKKVSPVKNASPPKKLFHPKSVSSRKSSTPKNGSCPKTVSSRKKSASPEKMFYMKNLTNPKKFLRECNIYVKIPIFLTSENFGKFLRWKSICTSFPFPVIVSSLKKAFPPKNVSPPKKCFTWKIWLTRKKCLRGCNIYV